MIGLYTATAVLFLLSLIFSREKTQKALKTGGLMFLNLLPSFLSILMLVAVVLFALGPETLQSWMGESSGPWAFVIAAVSGSIAMIPGFVAYPMAAVLVKNGISYPVVGVFITTLMMVGILTLPLEKKFFGLKLALVRNGLSFLGALVVGGLLALVWNFL